MPGPDLTLLTQAAQAAGQIALQHWRGPVEHWDKGGGLGPVSAADLAVNAALETQLRGERPDYGWLSEESAPDAGRLAASRVFVVDPIDGTRAFLDGSDGFSISLAVVEGGRPIAAVVHLPARGQTYAAAADDPATLDGRPIAPREAPLEKAEVLTSRHSLDPAFWRGGAAPFRRAFRSSLAWRMCLVAEGRFPAALSLRPCWEWDIAAGALIAARAGCRVSDRHGLPMRLNTPAAQVDGMVVAAPRLQAALLAALAPHGCAA